jgi:hypothetical protein
MKKCLLKDKRREKMVVLGEKGRKPGSTCVEIA